MSFFCIPSPFELSEHVIVPAPPPKSQELSVPWCLTSKEQGEGNGELIDGMAQDVLHHGSGDEWLVSAVRFAQEQGFGGRFSGQSQRGQGVHDQIDPEHLHCF